MLKLLNPVFRRELKTTLRTWKTFVAIGLYVLFLVGVVAIILFSLQSSMVYNGFSPQSATTMYSVMSGFQLGLILLIVPALTGGAISGERERQTLDLMLVTKMSSFSIILGKLASCLIVVMLMVVASLPVFGIILYYGGISFLNLLTMALFFLATAALVGSISIFFSSVFKKTVVALILTYLVIAFLSFGSFFVAIIFGQIGGRFVQMTTPPLMQIYAFFAANPFIAFMSVVDTQLGTSTANEFLSNIAYQLTNYTYQGTMKPITLPIWIANVGVDIVLVALFTTLSAIVIRPSRRRKK